MKRREFIQAWIRTGILGVFAIIVGAFIYKGKIAHQQECGTGSQCQSCRKLKSCNLPESEKHKKNGKG